MATETPIAEIDAETLERELRDGARVVVVDVREPRDWERWHVDGGDAPVLNIPERALTADVPAALALLPVDAPVRVICTAGNASRRVTEILMRSGRDAASVRGGMRAWSGLVRAAAVPAGPGAHVLQFRREARGCLSYMVVGGEDALVVDPVADVSPYLRAASEHGATITHVVDTHVHADHLSGARTLARETGAGLHYSAAALARGLRGAEVRALQDGDQIDLGPVTVRVVALPGHTTDMIGLLVNGRALISGDSLFADSVARPDLEVGASGAPTAARTLWHTLTERVAALADDVVLLPGHYAGGRRAGPIAPTLGEVRRAVPQLRLPPEPFVEAILRDMPPRPANAEAIIAMNLGLQPVTADAGSLEVGGNNCAVDRRWAASR